MKFNFLALIILSIIFSGCKPDQTVEDEINANTEWKLRAVKLPLEKIKDKGSTYLAVHSQVYSKNAHTMVGLTVTVSMRNTSLTDSAYVLSAKSYDTHGEMIRSYIENPIFILPMETLEIVIPELNIDGGAGGNFIFDWATTNSKFEPIFDAVMISTLGQQGLSFSTQGTRIE